MTDNAALVHRIYEAFATQDVTFILSCLARDVEWVCPGPPSLPFAGSFAGRTNVAKFFSALYGSQTGVSLDVRSTHADRETVITVGRYRYTIAATGKKKDSLCAHVFRIRRGKVIHFLHLTDAIDWTPFLTQPATARAC